MDRPRAAKPSRQEPLTVLREGERYVVVAKPAGLPAIPTRQAPDGPSVVTELEALRRREGRGDEPRALVCHRLDVQTSGCMLLARDRAAARELMTHFRKRRIGKTYLALVLGAPHPASGRMEFRIGPDRSRTNAMQVVSRGGRLCETVYETLEPFRGVSLLRVRPTTGRTHQVRVALRHLGTPCAVDALYGGEEKLFLSRWKRAYRTGRGREERPLVDRVTLHAESLTFPEPGAPDDAEPVRVEAPLPRDLQSTLRQLRRWAAPGSL